MNPLVSDLDYGVGIGLGAFCVGVLVIGAALVWWDDRRDCTDQRRVEEVEAAFEEKTVAICLECGGFGITPINLAGHHYEQVCGYCRGTGYEIDDFTRWQAELDRDDVLYDQERDRRWSA